jgi:transposase
MSPGYRRERLSHKAPPVRRRGSYDSGDGSPHEGDGVGYNFRPVERDQQYLMPPSVRDWLPADHLAWFVLDVVDELDLDPIRARYRADGWGAAAFDPALMTALLLYAYATGERSSRRIEARCREDVGYRVVCANQVPDHATIARFRADHEAALGELFSEVLALCARAGLGRVGLLAIDGTKLAADASTDASRGPASIDAEIARILAEAAEVDAAEDAAYGPDRGDELPPELADRGSRLARLREARRQLAEADAERQQAYEAIVERRAGSEARTGRPAGGHGPKPDSVGRRTWSERNTTDPDARKMRARDGWIVGYNGQVVVAEDGLIVAAELTQQAGDVDQLAPMVEAARANIAAAGLRRPRWTTVLADAGYWSEANLAALEAMPGTRALIAPNPGRRRTPGSRVPARPGRDRMQRRLARPSSAARYRRRAAIVEPVFGELKAVRGVRRFQRRGFTACASEWRLHCLTHNLLKLWRSGSRPDSTGRPPARARVRRERRPR